MAQMTIVFWRDIPAQVIVKKGREAAKVQLSERFEKAIDRAAMKAHLRDTDSYLAEWRRAAPVEVSDALQEEADRKAAEIEQLYDDARLKTLVDAGGLDAASATKVG
jgi:hypothetical protein